MRKTVRLQKYLSECGVSSRRKAIDLIDEGKIRVNGELASEAGQRITPGVDRVTVGKKPALLPQRGVIFLNKPRGVVSTFADPGGRKTLADYITKKHRGYISAGRLDYDSTGLIVLTNDGNLAQKLSHPRYGMDRVYQVRIEGHLDAKLKIRLKKGVRIEGKPVKMKLTDFKQQEKATWITVTVNEGRNRIIRRVFERIQHPVLKLQRVQHGPCKLGTLKVGQTRTLTEAEYKRLLKTVERNAVKQ